VSTRRRGAVAAVASLVLLGSPVAASPAVAAAPGLRIAPAPVFLSPDGDGRRDVAPVAFHLARAAAVTVVVRRGADVVRGPVRLGRLEVGRHAWTWDGTWADGRTVADGTYTVVVRATRDGRRERAAVAAYVDTVGDAGRLVTTRPTVYPMATAVSDSVHISYLREGWDAEEAASYGAASDPSLDVGLTVVDGQGRAVWHDRWSPEYLAQPGRGLTFTFPWYARGQGGAPLPAGSYAARVRVTDAAGNVSKFATPITVSHQQLQRTVWTSTVPAASATRYVPAGCGTLCTGGCTPTDSGRFPGGLSFVACPDPDKGTRAWFTAAPPVLASPADTFRVTATGGPSTPGGDDVGSLTGYVSVGPGDGSATTPWLSPSLDAPPYLPDRATPVAWGFATQDGDAFDVASFTVAYRYWVPVP